MIQAVAEAFMTHRNFTAVYVDPRGAQYELRLMAKDSSAATLHATELIPTDCKLVKIRREGEW